MILKVLVHTFDPLSKVDLGRRVFTYTNLPDNPTVSDVEDILKRKFSNISEKEREFAISEFNSSFVFDSISVVDTGREFNIYKPS